MSKAKGLGLSVMGLASMIALVGTLLSGIAVYLGTFPKDFHIGIGVFSVALSVITHVLNASVSPMNFISVLFLVGALWTGLMNIEGKSGGTNLHIIVGPLALALSVLASILNIQFYMKAKRKS
jgi:hypothetical protein